MTVAVVRYAFRQEADTVTIDATYRVTPISSSNIETARASALGATGVPAIGATRYSAKTKCYARTARPVGGGDTSNVWEVDVSWRTETFDDLIERAASGTVIERGWSAVAENVLRVRHPTSGATFTLGSATNGTIAQIANSEPRLVRWWDKVYDTDPSAAAFALVGSINSVTFGAKPAGTWLCNVFEARQVRTDSGVRYLAHIEAAYKPETWVAVVRTLTWNNRTIASITAATKATGSYSVYRSAAFGTYLPTF